MQANNPGQNGSNNKPSGLSWSSPSPSNNMTSPLLGGAKPASVPASKPAATPVSAVKPTVTSAPAPASKPRAASATSKGRGNTAGGFIGGVVVGALLVWGWYGLSPSAPATSSNSNTTQTVGAGNTQVGSVAIADSQTESIMTTPTTPATGSANNLTVASPQDAGMDVVIANANVSVPTWVVVYELAGNKPVHALGATMFFPEYNGKGGVVSLLRATQPNTTYFVGQAVDNGDHVFTPHTDKEVMDVAGNYAGVNFKTK